MLQSACCFVLVCSLYFSTKAKCFSSFFLFVAIICSKCFQLHHSCVGVVVLFCCCILYVHGVATVRLALLQYYVYGVSASYPYVAARRCGVGGLGVWVVLVCAGRWLGGVVGGGGWGFVGGGGGGFGGAPEVGGGESPRHMGEWARFEGRVVAFYFLLPCGVSEAGQVQRKGFLLPCGVSGGNVGLKEGLPLVQGK